MAIILNEWRYRWMDGPDDKNAKLNLSLTTNDQLRFRLCGKTVGHPTNPDGRCVYVSAPTSFDARTRTIRTATGREYVLGTFGGADEAEHLEYVRKDIARNKRIATPLQRRNLAAGSSDDTVLHLDIHNEVEDALKPQ